MLEIRASKLPDDSRLWLVAGDTAHDFANDLSTIRTHAHLLETQQDDKTAESLQAIGNAIDFGSSMTDSLLAVARK